MQEKLTKLARQISRIDYTKPAHTSLVTKLKFHAVRLLQKNLGKQNPEYTDYKYWRDNGWTGSVRPWKQT